MTKENFKCKKCGKSFDSKRGLSIHQTQMHGGKEEKNSESEAPEEEKMRTLPNTITLNVNHLIAGVFVLGLALGFSAGIAATNFQGLTESLDSNKQPTQGSQNSEESTISVMKDIAEQMNIDSGELEKQVKSSSGEEIQQDKSEISDAAGSIGTPTFFIGNSEIGYTEISGAQPYSRMRPVIDRKLEEAESGNSSIGSDEYRLENIGFEGEPVMGEESASINIIEYSDFGCPWCAEWHGFDAIPQRPIDQEKSFQKIRDNYVENGQVQFIAKDYPVQQLHPEALTAHKAANYVWKNYPDKYWSYSQKIYEERERW